MSKKLRIVTAFILALSVIVAVTGCGGSKQPTQKENTGTVQSSEEKTTKAEEQKPEVTLTLYGPGAGGTSGVQQSAVFKWIKQKLNINVDIDYSYTKEKYQTMMASDSLPDLSFFDDSSLVGQLVKGGLALELDQLIETNGQNIKKYAPLMLDFVKKYESADTNKIYFLNHQVSKNQIWPQGTHIGPCIRWDYYKELGAPEMKSDRDFVDIVAQILQKHPTNEDGKKNVGISVWADWGTTWPVFCWGAYAKNLNETNGPLTLEKSTNKIVNVYSEEGQMQQGLEFLNYAYRKGVLDADSFTQKFTDVQAKFNTAQSIGTVLTIGDDGTKYLEGKSLTGKGYTSMYSPVNIQGTKNAFYYYTPTGRVPIWVISHNTKYPDRCMDFLNLLYSPEAFMVVVNGVQGEEWTVDDAGNYKFTDAHFQHMKEASRDITDKYGFGLMNSWSFQDWDNNPETGKPFNIQFIDPAYYDKTLNSVQKDILSYYDAKMPLDLVKKEYPDIPVDNSSVAWNAFSSVVLPTDIKLIDANIQSYLSKEVVKVIMTKTEADFKAELATMRKEIEKLGVQKEIDYLMPKLQDALKMQEDFYNANK